jgi:hypothetical protein
MLSPENHKPAASIPNHSGIFSGGRQRRIVTGAKPAPAAAGCATEDDDDGQPDAS